jgi:ferredoxin
MAYRITEACNGCGACKRICPARAIAGEKQAAHSIVENRCIECGACGRVCPQESVLDGQGEVCARVKRSQWKKPVTDPKACVSCGMCAEACPVGCLVMAGSPAEGKPEPRPRLSDEKACIGCGLCCAACPVGAAVME